MIPTCPRTGDVGAGLVADVGRGHATGSHRLRTAHDVVRHLGDVDTDVDHRSAALQILAAEHAPVGDAAPTQRLHANVLDVAEYSGVRLVFKDGGLGIKTPLEADDEMLAGLFGSIDHRLAFGGIHRHRLFDDDVQASFKRGDRVRRMQTVGRAH